MLPFTPPTDLIYRNTRETLRVLLMVVLIFSAIMIFFFGYGAFSILGRQSVLDEWILPLGAMSAIYAVLTGIFILAAVVTRLIEGRNIRKTLEGPHWAAWQYEAGEWQQYATAQHEAMLAMLPEGMRASLLRAGLGAGIALFFTALGGGLMFGVMPPDYPGRATLLILIPAVGVGAAAILGTSGFLSPIQQRRMVERQHRLMTRVATPRVYFTGKGLYREYDGYTGLGGLQDAEVMSGSPPSVVLKVWQRSGRVSLLVDVSTPVPREREPEAAALVERYRKERLGK
jgi:hypothetical protein